MERKEKRKKTKISVFLWFLGPQPYTGQNSVLDARPNKGGLRAVVSHQSLGLFLGTAQAHLLTKLFHELLP